MAQLTCQRLCVGYDGQSVLQDLTFELLAGDYLCIVGENGSGKSTLMKTILGLQTPISGSILTGDGLRKNEIGYLPQQTQVSDKCSCSKGIQREETPASSLSFSSQAWSPHHMALIKPGFSSAVFFISSKLTAV